MQLLNTLRALPFFYIIKTQYLLIYFGQIFQSLLRIFCGWPLCRVEKSVVIYWRWVVQHLQ